MTRAEEEVVWYAKSVNWDYNKICEYIFNNMHHTRYSELIGNTANEKAHYIINKFKPKMETKTKVTVLGEEPKKELKKIDFIFYAEQREPIPIGNENKSASFWENVILIEKDYEHGLDLILAYNNSFTAGEKCRCLILGYWNDGIV